MENYRRNIENKKQTILFLNRRGYSTFIMCRTCGHVVKCKNCNIPLTYHNFDDRLKCHYCGFETSIMNKCPECTSDKIKYFGTGTQKVEEELKKLFPEITTIRMDIDTVSKKNSHEEILNEFKNNNIDCLIGTQMVVKGHHFPNVTLVGVIAADSSINSDDYKSVERGFQTLVQVAGRSGRGQKEGQVIIQTHNPDHFAIECATSHDYIKFYNNEMEYRKNMIYPPYCHLVSILIESKNENLLIKSCQDIKKYLDEHLSHVKIYGPAQSIIYRMNDIYRMRILIKFKDSSLVYESLKTINDYYNKKLNGKVRVICDFNPYSQI